MKNQVCKKVRVTMTEGNMNNCNHLTVPVKPWRVTLNQICNFAIMVIFYQLYVGTCLVTYILCTKLRVIYDDVDFYKNQEGN